MRIVFIDLHCINFLVRPYIQIKSKNKVATYKHKFIIDYAMKEGIEVCNYITGKETTIPSIARVSRILKYDKEKKIARWEANYVMKHCFAPASNIKIITKKEDIRSDDIVIGYFYKKYQRDIIAGLNAQKIMMGNHFVEINEPVDLEKIGIKGFVNEIDLSDNPFVNAYIKIRPEKNIVCPYIYANRFVDKQKERKNKAMAIGTLSTCKGNAGYKLYRDMFHTEWIQLMRKTIYEEAEKYSEYIDSYISYIYEDKLEISEDDNIFIRIYKKMVNKYKPWRQSKYTSFDMVNKFNEYLCFVCPEEVVGMPGIGFVEGMACGTAYIGLDTSYYRKLGLKPGIDYITYDGTLEDLIDKIKYCQAHVEETRKIGINGREFVYKNFNQKVVAKNLFDKFNELVYREH